MGNGCAATDDTLPVGAEADRPGAETAIAATLSGGRCGTPDTLAGKSPPRAVHTKTTASTPERRLSPRRVGGTPGAG